MRSLNINVMWVLCLIVSCGQENAAEIPQAGATANDDLVCLGNPDSNLICRPAAEFWDCSAMPNGQKKCAHALPQTPDGAADWQCTQQQQRQIICQHSGSQAPGAADWQCTTDDQQTICQKPIPEPPGAGTWGCQLDQEFTLTCTSQPPSESPTGNSQWLCLWSDSAESELPLPDGPLATIETRKETYQGTPALYARVTFNKGFVDNTYGANSSSGYGKKGKEQPHTFEQLEKSDHVALFFADGSGKTTLSLKLDYISSASDPSGYGCLGIAGGEGEMIQGPSSAILGAQSSLGVNLNTYQYVLLQDSPATDENYAPNPAYPRWIFDVWYETWVRLDAFGAAGPGQVTIESVHASPSRLGTNSIPVKAGACW